MAVPYAKLRPGGAPTAQDVARMQDNTGRVLADMQQALLPQWANITKLGNGWTPIAGGTGGSAGSVHGPPSGVSYCKDITGVVRLRGVITGGTESDTATGTVFTLPVGMRPFFESLFALWNLATVAVVDNGDVRVVTGATYVDLGGISFIAEQ